LRVKVVDDGGTQRQPADFKARRRAAVLVVVRAAEARVSLSELFEAT